MFVNNPEKMNLKKILPDIQSLLAAKWVLLDHPPGFSEFSRVTRTFEHEAMTCAALDALLMKYDKEGDEHLCSQ